MNELCEYHQNLMADIRREADASGILMVEAFFDRMTERLTEAGELEVADRAYFQSGDGGQKLRIDGYAGDPRDSEGVLGLIVCDFVDSEELQTFGKGDVPPILNPLIRFLKKARTEEFRDALNEVNPAFQVSDLIITTWPRVTKVKLILVSNRQYIGRDDTVRLGRAVTRGKCALLPSGQSQDEQGDSENRQRRTRTLLPIQQWPVGHCRWRNQPANRKRFDHLVH